MHYIILHNKNATIFACTGSGTTIHSHTIPTRVEKLTKRMQEGLKGGAIREIDDHDEAEALIEKAGKANKLPVYTETTTPEVKSSKGKGGKGKGKEETLEEKLTKMKPEELLAYYKENFDVTEADEKAFGEMPTKEQIEFLID